MRVSRGAPQEGAALPKPVHWPHLSSPEGAAVAAATPLRRQAFGGGVSSCRAEASHPLSKAPFLCVKQPVKSP